MAVGTTVIRDVSETLRKLVRSNVPDLSGANAVTFESPGELSPGATPRLSIYLYQIVRNHTLSAMPPSIARRGADFTSIAAPAAVDLLYMFVPYAKHPETDLILADAIKQLFHDTQTLRGPMLQGSLPKTGNTELDIIPEDMSVDLLRSVWMGFPHKPHRLSFFYIISPVRIPSGVSETVDLVTTAKVDAHSVSGREL